MTNWKAQDIILKVIINIYHNVNRFIQTVVYFVQLCHRNITNVVLETQQTVTENHINFYKSPISSIPSLSVTKALSSIT